MTIHRLPPAPLGPPPPLGEGRPQGAGLRALHTRWMIDHATAVDPSTYKNHARARTLCDEVPHPLPDHPSVGEVAQWMRELWESGRYKSRRSIIGLRGCLSVWYAYGQTLSISHGNPAAPSHPAWKKQDRGARRDERHAAPLDIPDSELPRLVADLPPTWRACVLFCRFLGVRPSEARGVKAWGVENDFALALDGQTHVVRIRRQRIVTHGGDPWACRPYLKAHEPSRTLPIPEALWAELETLIAAGPPEVRVGRGGGERRTVDFLFPMHTTNEISALNKAMQATGIVPEGRGLYTARHAFVRASSQGGVEARTLQKTVGHAWMNTTQGYIDRAGNQPAVSVESIARATPAGWTAAGKSSGAAAEGAASAKAPRALPGSAAASTRARAGSRTGDTSFAAAAREHPAVAVQKEAGVTASDVRASSTVTPRCQTRNPQPTGAPDESETAGFESPSNIAKPETEGRK